MKSDPKLANRWPAGKVRSCLRKRQKAKLVRFLKARYEERFFKPIRCLKQPARNTQGYGFAIMALCALLVESIQSYRDGLPSTHRGELNRMKTYKPPRRYKIPKKEWPRNGGQVFRKFFSAYRSLFPEVDGTEFYKNIRNGLLHQAQTKDGWLIRTEQRKLWNQTDKIIDRNLFAEGLENAFNSYLKELKRHAWKSDVWQKAERKIWWLVRLS